VARRRVRRKSRRLLARLVWASDWQRKRESYILGSSREVWITSIRNFVLDGATARFPGGDSLADLDPDAYVKQRATPYLADLNQAREAYEAHKGYKTVTRYEDLRNEPFQEIQRICSALRMPVKEEQLRAVIAKHSWDNIPEDQKGPGKRRRKAEPGGWREDLTPEQAQVVEQITGPVLKEYYSD
jgi:hypothetical protein